MSTSPPPFAQPMPQLTEENLRQLAAARVASRKIKRAVSVANFDGWTIAVCGALTLGLGFGDPSSIAIGLVLGAIAFVELRSAARLKRMKVDALKTLSLNQIVLALLLIAYAAWKLYATAQPGRAMAAAGLDDPQLASLVTPDIENMTRMLMQLVYGGVIAIAIFAQGGMALYYATRSKHLKAYLAETPTWIITLQDAGVGL